MKNELLGSLKSSSNPLKGVEPKMSLKSKERALPVIEEDKREQDEGPGGEKKSSGKPMKKGGDVGEIMDGAEEEGEREEGKRTPDFAKKISLSSGTKRK